MKIGERFKIKGFKNELSYLDENTIIVHCYRKKWDKHYEVRIDAEDLPKIIERYSSISIRDRGNKWIYAIGVERKKYRNGKANRNRLLHRFINNTPNHLQTDHINRNTLDNRKSNLRSVTNAQNSQNYGVSKKSKSGIRNVFWSKGLGKWRVMIQKDGKKHHFGYYDDINEAAKVAKQKRKELFSYSTD